MPTSQVGSFVVYAPRPRATVIPLRENAMGAQVTVLATASSAEARQLRMHCFCGDDLLSRDGPWLRALGPSAEDSASGETRLVFRYRAGTGEEHSVEVGRMSRDALEECLEIAGALRLDAADRRWRCLAERVGPVPRVVDAVTKTIALSGREIVAARRLVHPSHIIDKLMMRDRALAMAEVETLLFLTRPQIEALRCA